MSEFDLGGAVGDFGGGGGLFGDGAVTQGIPSYGTAPDASLGNLPGMQNYNNANQAVSVGPTWWNPATWGGGNTAVPTAANPDPSGAGGMGAGTGSGGSSWFSQLFGGGGTGGKGGASTLSQLLGLGTAGLGA